MGAVASTRLKARGIRCYVWHVVRAAAWRLLAVECETAGIRNRTAEPLRALSSQTVRGVPSRRAELPQHCSSTTGAQRQQNGS